MPHDLLTENRLHDLPPSWDGHPVTWGSWEKPLGAVFVCPPPKIPDHCERCGSIEKQPRNRGVVRPAALVMYPWTLYVQRCPDCYLDTVWDTGADEWWTLDDTDYEDKGSTPPTPEPPGPPPAPKLSPKERALARSRAAVAKAQAEQATLF